MRDGEPAGSTSDASSNAMKLARAELERMIRAGETACAERCLAAVGGQIMADDALDLIYSEFLIRE